MPSTTSLGMTSVLSDDESSNDLASRTWTCIAVTCATAAWSKAVQQELEILQKQGKLHKDTILIVVEDPASGIGSGGATLNALLVIAEKLSAKFKYPVISSEVLTNAHILILHQGRQYPFDTCSKAFVMLPCQSSDNQSNYCSSLTTNLEHVLNLVQVLHAGSPPGLWVCSTDMVLLMSNTEKLNFDDNPDGIMVCVPADIDWAVEHGTVVIDPQGYVENILYGASVEVLEKHSTNGKRIPLACGIVYLSANVAEALLSFHELSPLDCCTYMGLDTGAKFIRVSLSFDILLAMSTGLTESDFMSGNCGKAYNKKFGYDFDSDTEMLMELGRTKVWEYLHKFKLKAELLETGYHNYWSEGKTSKNHVATFKTVAPQGLYHSISEGLVGTDTVIINSSISPTCEIGSGCVIQHCAIRGRMSIGDRCYISSANMTIVSEMNFDLKDDMCLLNFPVKVRYCDTVPTYFQVLFGNNDQMHLQISDVTATFCNESWIEFFTRTGINPEDIWSNDVPKDARTLFTANLFPVMQNFYILSWFQNGTTDPQILDRWRSEPRLSIKEVLEKTDPISALQYRREIFGNVTCEIIQSVLLQDQDQSLLPYFKLASSQGWSDKIFSCLDAIAIKVLSNPKTNGILKRVFFCIADLLGCLGGNDAGIRSGPAGNKAWNHAFSSLNTGYYHDAVRLLSDKRAQWIDKPEQMLRAARHYEKAAHFIIQRDVSTAQQFIDLKKSIKPQLEAWVTSECPARVDLIGAWTDTPPECYELKGSVVNVSFKLYDKKPIGAKAKRTKLMKILLVLHAEGGLQKEFGIENLEELMDYSRPNAPAALLKAAIIATGIIDVNSKESLESQLNKNLESGMELHTWANVPQGSGLGTSSILAGAISAALWTLAGKTFTRRDVIHIVLIIEQLLTTGGGWQDQVGGVTGGICRGFSEKGLPLEVKVDLIHLPKENIELLQQHIVLIFTGKVRLARNILQNTIRNWYARDIAVVQGFKEMWKKSQDVIRALHQGDLQTLGKLLNRYWQLKKMLAPGCEPVQIKSLMATLKPHVHGQVLTGAGGGGFLCAVTKIPNSHSFINNILEEMGYVGAKVYDATLDMEGLTVEIEGSCREIPHK